MMHMGCLSEQGPNNRFNRERPTASPSGSRRASRAGARLSGALCGAERRVAFVVRWRLSATNGHMTRTTWPVNSGHSE
jgi:hypothetical protein